MRRLLCLLLAFVVSFAAIGCGGDRDRGKNKDNQIKPREAPTSAER